MGAAAVEVVGAARLKSCDLCLGGATGAPGGSGCTIAVAAEDTADDNDLCICCATLYVVLVVDLLPIDILAAEPAVALLLLILLLLTMLLVVLILVVLVEEEEANFLNQFNKSLILVNILFVLILYP